MKVIERSLSERASVRAQHNNKLFVFPYDPYEWLLCVMSTRLTLFIMMTMSIMEVPFRNNLFNSFNIIINIVVRTFYAISNNYDKFFFFALSTFMVLSVSRTTVMQFLRVGYAGYWLTCERRAYRCRTWRIDFIACII